jgi:hypothetical protein
VRWWAAILVAVAVAWGLGRPAARAQPGAVDGRIARHLQEATVALQTGEYARAADLAGPVAREPNSIDEQDRAEAWRIYGLALFFLDRHGEAEGALLEYMKLDVDAHLDPALVPPEAIVFFEDVRSRHAAELRQYRPMKKVTVRAFAANLLPPFGQVQNGHRGKAWLIGTSEVLLIGAHIGSYYLLRKWCSSTDGTCSGGETDHTSDAKRVRVLNLVSGGLLIGVVAYGIADGFVNFYRQRRRRAAVEAPMSVGVVPTHRGAYLSLRGRF